MITLSVKGIREPSLVWNFLIHVFLADSFMIHGFAYCILKNVGAHALAYLVASNSTVIRE